MLQYSSNILLRQQRQSSPSMLPAAFQSIYEVKSFPEYRGQVESINRKATMKEASFVDPRASQLITTLSVKRIAITCLLLSVHQEEWILWNSGDYVIDKLLDLPFLRILFKAGVHNMILPTLKLQSLLLIVLIGGMHFKSFASADLSICSPVYYCVRILLTSYIDD